MNNSNQGEYWEKRLSDNFGLHGTGFLGLGKNFNKWMYRIRAKVLERELGKLNIKPVEYRILDIGSGTGFYVDLWRQFGCKKVVGADITNVSVENLRKNFPEYEFYKMDIGNDQKDIDQIIDRQFDIVSAFDVSFILLMTSAIKTPLRIYMIALLMGVISSSQKISCIKTIFRQNTRRGGR